MSIVAKISEIIIDEKSLEQTTQGASVSGNIYWQFDDYYFPEQNWYDYVSPLLMWWSTSIIEVLSGSCEKATLLFMDGPQKIIIRAKDADTIIFECYRSDIQECPIHVFNVDIKILLRRMILTMTRFVEWFYRQDFSFDDSLKGEIDQIKENAEKFKRMG